jgi:hypothetical protein
MANWPWQSASSWHHLDEAVVRIKHFGAVSIVHVTHPQENNKLGCSSRCWEFRELVCGELHIQGDNVKKYYNHHQICPEGGQPPGDR